MVINRWKHNWPGVTNENMELNKIQTKQGPLHPYWIAHFLHCFAFVSFYSLGCCYWLVWLSVIFSVGLDAVADWPSGVPGGFLVAWWLIWLAAGRHFYLYDNYYLFDIFDNKLVLKMLFLNSACNSHKWKRSVKKVININLLVLTTRLCQDRLRHLTASAKAENWNI